MADSEAPQGRAIIIASWAGTAAFALTAGPAAAGVEALAYPSVVLALVLFAVSVPISLYALGRAAVRTARGGERITISGLFFLAGSAPAAVRRLLVGSLAGAVAVTAATASAEPFGVLVPVYQLALCGLWAARHGTFPLIPEPASPPLPSSGDESANRERPPPDRRSGGGTGRPA